MPAPRNLRTLCSALEYFRLPAALGSLREDALRIWNRPFREIAELSESELAEASLTSLILLDESYEGAPLRDSEKPMRFVPCVLRNFATNKLVPGSALRRDDGMLLVMLNLPAGDLTFQDFIRGRLIGREEEKNRTRQFFDDILSSKLLVASFAAHEVYQKFAASGAEESKELAMVTKLLGEAIDAITEGLEEQGLRSKPIPDSGAASMQRSMDSQSL